MYTELKDKVIQVLLTKEADRILWLLLCCLDTLLIVTSHTSQFHLHILHVPSWKKCDKGKQSL